MRRLILFCCALLCLLPVLSNRVAAQVAGGTISGTVMDSSGSVVQNARVDITNQATAVIRTVTTNEAGIYTAPNLQPGDYQVKVTAQGFAPKAANLTLNVGDELNLSISLAIGAIDQTIQIMDTPASIELTSSALSAVVAGSVVRDLPLNGRSWTDLATLQAGVTGITTQQGFDQGASRGNRGFGAQISIDGGRPTQNSYRLDGISINDYANSGPGSVIGVNLGVDAIGEFSVLTSNYGAEYGKTSGGVINAVTRSGTNQFHGAAYSFFRNSGMDARNYFDKATPPPFARYQYGASVGGRIRKDRTFFFGDYEGIKQDLSTTATANVLSNAARARVTNPAVLKYIGLFPLANQNASTSGDIAQYNFINQELVHENFFTTRIDEKVSAKDSFFGTYLYDDTPFTIGDAQYLTLDSSKTRRQNFILEENHVFSSSFINAARFGLNRQNVANNIGVKALNPLAADTSLAIIAGRTAPGVNVPGLTRVVGGVGSSPSYLFRFTTFQGYDDAFLTRGTHSLKFGVAFERLQNNIVALSNPNGLFNFSSVNALIANTPSRLQAGIASTLSPRNLRQNMFGTYIQDDWHLKPNLTINLGVRYEMSSVPVEVANKLSTLRNLSDPTPHLGNPYFYNPTYKNFEPRVGVVYDPFKDHKTSIRAGYGIYDVLPLLYQFEILSVLSAPYFEIGSTSDPAVRLGADPAYVQNALVAKVSTLGQAYIQPSPKRTYVSQWNLSIQRELARDVTLTFGYAGSRALHLPYRVEDANQVLPTKTAQGYLWPSTAGIPVNPNAGTIRALWWMSKSSYNALESDLSARVGHNLQIKGAFTWAKSLDNNSATIAGDSFSNSVPSLDWYDTSLSYGPSDFNVAKIFVANAIYTIPDAHDLHALTSAFRNGWQLGGIYTQRTGTPFTPLIGGDPLGKGGSDPWDYPDRVVGCDMVNHNFRQNGLAYVNFACFPVPGGATPNPHLRGNTSRNVITGPGLAELDMSLFKNNYVRKISETFNVQLRAEAFNIANHTNFNPPNNNNEQLYNGSLAPLSTGGVLTAPTATTSRQLQFAAKIIF